MNTIYTIGYGAGWSPAMVLATLQQLDAMLLDIRLRPWSRTPAWQRSALHALLGPRRYVHVPALGNLNYNNGGPITLQAPEAGVAFVGRQLARQNVVLLCGCRYVAACHRLPAAMLLHERLGVAVVHLEPSE